MHYTPNTWRQGAYINHSQFDYSECLGNCGIHFIIPHHLFFQPLFNVKRMEDLNDTEGLHVILTLNFWLRCLEEHSLHYQL